MVAEPEWETGIGSNGGPALTGSPLDSSGDGTAAGRKSVTPLQAGATPNPASGTSIQPDNPGPLDEQIVQPVPTPDEPLKKRNREYYPVQRPTDTPRSEERFVQSTALVDRRVDELCEQILERCVASEKSFLIVASRWNPRPIAETVVHRTSPDRLYRTRVSGDSSFEESAGEKLLSEYRLIPKSGERTFILETAQEGNLSPGILHILGDGFVEFNQRLDEFGLKVVLALTLTKPRSVALIRHSLFEAAWHQRWLDHLARLSQIPRSELQKVEHLLNNHVPNGTASGDECDHRIFAGLTPLADDAENKAVSQLEKELLTKIDEAVRSEAGSHTGRESFSGLLRGKQHEPPDEIVKVMILVSAFGNKPRVSEFRSLCEVLLQPGSVDHIDQLPPGLRSKTASDLLDAQSAGLRLELPTWHTVFGKTFDEKIDKAGLKIANGRIDFAGRWGAINPREEILDHHPSIVKEALDRVIDSGALHRLPLSLAKSLMELFARSQQILDEALLAAALASAPGRRDLPSDSGGDADTRLVEETIAIAKWLGETSRRLGELLAVFAATTSPGDNQDHAFWRLVGHLRAKWRTDLISSQVLEGGLLIVLSRADAATAPALVNSVYDIFDRSADTGSRRLIVELMEGIVDWACDTLDARPEMWLHGFKAMLPRARQSDYRAGLAALAVERVIQYDIRWRAAAYEEFGSGPLSAIVFGEQRTQPGSLLDENARTILDCMFGCPVISLLKSQLALSRLIDRDQDGEKESDADMICENAERRLQDVLWILVSGVPDREFISLKPDLQAIFRDLLELLTQSSGAERPKNLGYAAERIISSAANYKGDPAFPDPRDQLSPWLNLYSVFRTAALVHWRFLALGCGPLSPGSQAATRIISVVEYLAQKAELSEIIRSLFILKNASDYLVRIAGGRRALGAADVYRQKSAAIEKLRVALMKRLEAAPQQLAT